MPTVQLFDLGEIKRGFNKVIIYILILGEVQKRKHFAPGCFYKSYVGQLDVGAQSPSFESRGRQNKTAGQN